MVVVGAVGGTDWSELGTLWIDVTLTMHSIYTYTYTVHKRDSSTIFNHYGDVYIHHPCFCYAVHTFYSMYWLFILKCLYLGVSYITLVSNPCVNKE